MTKKIIELVKEFSPHPYGRTIKADGLTSGEAFRKDILVPALTNFDHVHVDLSGYNRYGRSFLDEAFGGLIREDRYDATDLKKRLTYSHNSVKSIIEIIDERISAAEQASITD